MSGEGALARQLRVPGGGADVLARREAWALAWARAAAAVALVGTFTGPALVNIAAALALLGFACVPSAGRRLRDVLASPLGRAALLLLAVLAASALWSEATIHARLRELAGWRTVLLLLVWLAIFDQPAARRKALLAFVAAAALGSAYSFWAWAHGYSTTASNHGLAGIVWRDPVAQGLAFSLACFLAMMMLFAERDAGWRLRAALAAATLLLLANLVFVTSSRTGYLVLVVLLAATALQRLRGWRRPAALAALPLLAALAISISPMLQMRFGLAVQELRAPLATEQTSSMGMRYVIWNVSVQLLRERPLLGYGLAGIAPAYERAIRNSSYTGWAATPVGDPHNQFLRVQLEAGLAGTVAFAWFLVACFRQRGEEPHRYWGRAVLLGWCAASLATSLFSMASEGHMLMLSLGVLLSGPAGAGPSAADHSGGDPAEGKAA